MWQAPQLGATPAALLRWADCLNTGSAARLAMVWHDAQKASAEVCRLTSIDPTMTIAPTTAPSAAGASIANHRRHCIVIFRVLVRGRPHRSARHSSPQSRYIQTRFRVVNHSSHSPRRSWPFRRWLLPLHRCHNAAPRFVCFLSRTPSTICKILLGYIHPLTPSRRASTRACTLKSWNQSDRN